MQSPLFRFAVIADSHIEPEPTGSSTRNNMRNAAVVSMLNASKPDFVIHCGDILHVPAFGPHFDNAAAVSKSIYRPLQMPIYSTPGNQDIGDKPSTWMPAPAATPECTKLYEQYYGPAYQGIEHKGCHFVFINSPILNSGHDIERQQREWLESHLRTVQGKRIFLVTHYPVYLLDEHEASHYDNIDEPARGWLLDCIDRYGIEGVFSGHVHNFFYNQRKDAHFYILPSTSFVRRDYAELFQIAPAEQAEFGRNEPAKLGFLLVDVMPAGHHVHYVRSYGVTGADHDRAADVMPSSVFCADGPGLGVTLRHQWAQISTISANNTTDEFIRKRVRSDFALEGMWHLGIKSARVFLDDLRDAGSHERIVLLSRLGYQIHVQSRGLPSGVDIDFIEGNAAILHCWEIVVPFGQVADLLALLEKFPGRRVSVAVAKFENSAQYRHEQINYPHFLAAGFLVESDRQKVASLMETAAARGQQPYGVVYRTTSSDDPCAAALAARTALGGSGPTAILTASWAASDPGPCNADDEGIAGYMLKLLAAATIPGCKIMLDMFADLDRGYYPRHGVVDRHYDPRPAGRLIRNTHRLFSELDSRPVYVSGAAHGASGWHAQLRAGSHDLLLSSAEAGSHATDAWPAWACGATRLRLIDLLGGQEQCIAGSDVSGRQNSGARIEPWPKYIAVVAPG
nr:metallophosphoesterase [Candidimonas nitroreducens]